MQNRITSAQAGRAEKEASRIRALTVQVVGGSIRRLYAQNLAMPKISLYIPDDLVERIKKEQSRYQSFSGFCCSMIGESLDAREQKQELFETLKRQRQAHG